MTNSDNFFDTNEFKVNENNLEKLNKLETEIIMNAKMFRDSSRGTSTKGKNELERLMNKFVQEVIDK